MESSTTFKRIFSPNTDIEKIPAPLRSHISSPNLSPSIVAVRLAGCGFWLPLGIGKGDGVFETGSAKDQLKTRTSSTSNLPESNAFSTFTPACTTGGSYLNNPEPA
ncbi:hypothetical protein AVEN_232383-1 [Araneus ventricosus]|uniref:Uncharacterized protein n=1 Tax=Araneus ventricosus TaxID=182803 RepID=A0A4Y2CTZ7_ARAVE|nr:hypothetical protein AVEN_232383-1 [Araneus ventricosus]